MAWVKLDDAFSMNPKVGMLSDNAYRAYVDVLCWCNRMLTDGVIPEPLVARVSACSDPAAAVDELVDAGLWIMGTTPSRHGVTHGECHIEVRGYLEYQPSKEQVERRRLKDRERQAQQRSKSRHGVTPPVTPPVSHDAPVPVPLTTPLTPTSGGTTEPVDPVGESQGSRNEGTNPRARGTNPRAIADGYKRKLLAAMDDCPDCLGKGVVLGEDAKARECPTCREAVRDAL